MEGAQAKLDAIQAEREQVASYLENLRAAFARTELGGLLAAGPRLDSAEALIAAPEAEEDSQPRKAPAKKQR